MYDILTMIVICIQDTKPVDFVTRVNEYARDTRYITGDTEVCKLKNDKVVSILDPEYFGIYSNKMRIDHLKKVYIRNIANAWATMEKEDQEYIFETFAR